MKHPRHMTFKNEPYLDYIRAQKCCVLSCIHKERRIDPHHLWGAHNNDYLAVPLCRPMHTLLGTMPVYEFEELYQVNLTEEALYYLMNYAGFNIR